MKSTLSILLIFCLASCSNSALQKEMDKVKSELKLAKATIEDIKIQIEPEGKLVHFVFFKLKPDTDELALIEEIKKLESIEVVKDLQVGPFENLDDDRALDQFGLVMEMSFDNADTYKVYQTHPIHLALREKAKPFLAGPPATYDYIKK